MERATEINISMHENSSITSYKLLAYTNAVVTYNIKGSK